MATVNPFDQFDAQGDAPENPFDQFGYGAGDYAQSLGGGVNRGLTYMMGLPVELGNLAAEHVPGPLLRATGLGDLAIDESKRVGGA